MKIIHAIASCKYIAVDDALDKKFPSNKSLSPKTKSCATFLAPNKNTLHWIGANNGALFLEIDKEHDKSFGKSSLLPVFLHWHKHC